MKPFYGLLTYLGHGLGIALAVPLWAAAGILMALALVLAGAPTSWFFLETVPDETPEVPGTGPGPDDGRDGVPDCVRPH